MSAIRTVLVDLGNVLVRVHPRRMTAALAARAACPAEVAERALYGDRRKWALDRGDVTFDEYRAAVEAAVGAACCDEPWFRAAWQAVFDPRDEAPLLLHALRGAGCRLVVASNTDPAHWEWLRRVPTIASIPEACLSFELRALKPERAFYERALGRIGAEPAECLLVDDREENVEGARAAGLRAARYPMEDARPFIEGTLPGLLDGGGGG